jgi:hypothetical protein
MNIRAVCTIYHFEMARAGRTLMQTIISPVISTSLYFVVFGAAIGSRIKEIDGVSYGAFIVPCLIMMMLLTQSTSNASFGMDLPGFMRAFTDETSYAQVQDFVNQVRPLVAEGAEVIIPAGGLPMLLFARERPFVIDGALVLNGIVALAKAAEMALSIHRLTGSVVSRRGSYAKASAECVEEYLSNRW